MRPAGLAQVVHGRRIGQATREAQHLLVSATVTQRTWRVYDASREPALTDGGPRHRSQVLHCWTEASHRIHTEFEPQGHQTRVTLNLNTFLSRDIHVDRQSTESRCYLPSPPGSCTYRTNFMPCLLTATAMVRHPSCLIIRIPQPFGLHPVQFAQERPESILNPVLMGFHPGPSNVDQDRRASNSGRLSAFLRAQPPLPHGCGLLRQYSEERPLHPPKGALVYSQHYTPTHFPDLCAESVRCRTGLVGSINTAQDAILCRRPDNIHNPGV